MRTQAANDEPDALAHKSLRMQEVLGAFGLKALSSDSLAAVLQESCRLVTSELAVEHVKIAVANDGEAGHLVVAERGFDVDGPWRLEPGRGSSAGLCIRDGHPVVSGDAPADGRFDMGEVVERAGIRSVCNVPIRDLAEGGEAVWGVLEVDSTEPNAFGADDTAFLRLYANLIAGAIDRQRATARLHALAEDKQRLLAELQHRIANNLTVISSIIRVERSRAVNEEAEARLRTVADRIGGLRFVYERLYAAGEGDTVDLGDYLPELTHKLADFQGCTARAITVDARADARRVGADPATALGQIVAEALTNACKYAWPEGEGGRFTLRFEAGDDADTLTLRDDGPGLPDGALDGRANKGGGVGLGLIGGLARQAGGTAAWRNQDGAVLTVTMLRRVA